MKINITGISIVSIAMAGLLTSCAGDDASPGLEYMPDMYRTPALEPYAGNSFFPDSMEARKPVEGTIPMGYLPYGIPRGNEGYELAGQILKNPFPMNEATVARGKDLYTKFCVHCHGESGMGDGKTVTAGGFPPPPAYNSAQLVNLPEGKMFHSITYGKNLMGPHASQLTVEERWMIVRYVQTLQNPDAVQLSDSTNVEGAASDTVTVAEMAGQEEPTTEN